MHRSVLLVAAAGFAYHNVPPAALAEVYINEIFIDPGGSAVELRDEFIELRGAPGIPLDNHFLILVENEDNSSHNGAAGQIDNLFDLSGAAMGANDFLTLRQGGNLGTGGQPDSGPSPYSVAPGTTDLVNSGTGVGFGSGDGSTIGAQDALDEGKIENGGFTAMIIRNDGDPEANRPTIGLDLDVGNDGLDVPTGREGWAILDSIGIHAELREAVFGRTYAPINFGYDTPGEVVIVPGEGIATVDPGLEEGATYLGLGYEIEYIARWGNSTGQTEADWHISNLTDNPGSGSMGAPLDFRQSFTGEHGDLASNDPEVPPSQPTEEQGRLESSKGVPYGAKLLTTLGAPNYMTGDYNGDGYVSAADYVAWRDSLGAVGDESAHPPADANHDFLVDDADYQLWREQYPGRPEIGEAAPRAVPEPATLALAALGAALGASRRRARASRG